jgi:hypothetical protein
MLPVEKTEYGWNESARKPSIKKDGEEEREVKRGR